MLQTLTIIYLIYMFIALYLLCLFTITLLQNRKEMFFVPTPNKKYSVSVIIPAYNEQDSIEGTIRAVLDSDYGGLIEVIVVNDGSTDNTLKITRQLAQKYRKIFVFDKKNSGKADSINQAIRIAKGEIVGVVDADSYPDKHAIRSMVGFFNEENVAAVTTNILVKGEKNFLVRMQAIEYKVIAFTRKLLGFLDSIYVTPGPLALYRKKSLIKIGGFDKKNMTEDIELTWHLLHQGYAVKMSFVAKSTTVPPDTIKKWVKQRIRWNIGGYQTILKYRKNIFKKGMLGFFVLPFFAVSLILGVFGLGIFVYRTSRGFFSSYFSTKYSIEAQAALFSLKDVNLNPSVLNFLGIVLFALGLWFVFFSLNYINYKNSKKESFFSVLFYSLIYILLNPLITTTSLWKFATGRYSW